MSDILAFSGSIRQGSYNTRLLTLAAEMAGNAGANVKLINLADYPLPIFNQDFESESGLPDACIALKQLMRSHTGFLVACPEYNGSITPLLKNTLDWISRAHPDEPKGACYRGKTVALISASPGALGGLRGLSHVRDIFTNLGSLVIPEKLAVSLAHKAFDDQGQLLNAGQAEQLQTICQRLVAVTTALNS